MIYFSNYFFTAYDKIHCWSRMDINPEQMKNIIIPSPYTFKYPKFEIDVTINNTNIACDTYENLNETIGEWDVCDSKSRPFCRTNIDGVYVYLKINHSNSICENDKVIIQNFKL